MKTEAAFAAVCLIPFIADFLIRSAQWPCGDRFLMAAGVVFLIAYFVLIHRYPEQFKRMFRAIYSPENIYLLHIDRSSGSALADDIAAFLVPYQGVEILESRNVVWGGYSLVDAELRGMKRLLDMGTQWKYFINLSGQDFPLKSQAYIRDYLDGHFDTQFMQIADQKKARPETMNRLDTIFVEAFQKIFRTRIPRSFMNGVRPYIGTQWKIVSRRFCEFMTHDASVHAYKRYYKNTFIADESFFQTVLMNAFPQGAVINDDCRSIDWVPDGDIKLRPRTLRAGDADALIASKHLFARKFDLSEDAEIFSLLERHLETAPLPDNAEAMPLHAHA